jgi:molybdenum cofactor cytidylyltransferase
MLCDQPLISVQFLDRLVAVHQSSGRGIVAAEYGGEGGVPALFSRAYFPELAALRGSRGAKPIIIKYAKLAARIPLPEAAIDVDRREDILLLGRLAGATLSDADENGKDGRIV